MYNLGTEYDYAITSANDGNEPSFVKRYEYALEAVNDFNKFNDVGDAYEYRVVNFAEPNGKLWTKIFYRDGRVVVR